MPLYEYQCASCQKVHEVMQKFSDAPLETCPDCNGPVSKLISMSSFALKGSGWYTTDYKRSPAPSAPAAKPASDSATASAPAAAAPVAPAATTPSKPDKS
jgi:putative FmdB family regulatory protein